MDPSEIQKHRDAAQPDDGQPPEPPTETEPRETKARFDGAADQPEPADDAESAVAETYDASNERAEGLPPDEADDEAADETTNETDETADDDVTAVGEPLAAESNASADDSADDAPSDTSFDSETPASSADALADDDAATSDGPSSIDLTDEAETSEAPTPPADDDLPPSARQTVAPVRERAANDGGAEQTAGQPRASQSSPRVNYLPIPLSVQDAAGMEPGSSGPPRLVFDVTVEGAELIAEAAAQRVAARVDKLIDERIESKLDDLEWHRACQMRAILGK